MRPETLGTLLGLSLGVLVIGGCPLYRDGSIVGGATKETTTVDCHDGTTCPLAFPSCPPAWSRQYGGKCEAGGGIVEGSKIRDAGPRDAGRDGAPHP